MTRNFRTGALALALIASVSAGCGGDGAEPPTPPVLERCTADIRPPEGFRQRDVSTEPESDHLGIRIVYEDADGRILASLAGIPGEYAEGSSFGGHVEVAGAGKGDLYGEDERWALLWGGAEPCVPRAVIGEGFTKAEFVRTLTEIGVTA